MTYSSRILAVSLFSNPSGLGPARYGAEGTGRGCPGDRSIVCWAASIWPKWPSHMDLNSDDIFLNLIRYSP